MAALQLKQFDVDKDTDSWMSVWKLAEETLDDILNLSESALKIRLSDDQQILELVDDFLDVYPKTWRKDETLAMALDGSLKTNRREEIRTVIVKVYTKILALFTRFAKELGDKHNLFELNRLFRLVAVFKASNRNAVENIITEAFKTGQFTEEDVRIFMKTMEQELIDYNKNSVSFSKISFNGLEAFLEKCLIDFEGLVAISSVLFKNHIPQKILCEFSTSVAVFVDHLEEHYSMEQLMNISADLRGIFRILLTLADSVIASAYALFRSIINCLTSEDELYTVIINCLQYERFIFYYSIIYPMEEIINRCSGEHKVFINDTFEHIRWNFTKHILEQLKNRGLLAGLGSSTHKKVQEKIDYLVELLPHLSPHFIHLCLRHFGYETEETANALLNIGELPLDLQILMSVELKAVNPPTNVAQSSLFYDFNDDQICNSKSEESEKKSSDVLICMKPPALMLNQEVNSHTSSENGFGLKTMDNSRKDLTADVKIFLQRQNCKKNQSKIRSQPLSTEIFDVPDSEKVALRPTYERYRYEEATSEEYNLYDDEYDDTYEDQCHNYDLDFKESELALKKAGIEPNMNRISLDGEKDEIAKSDEDEKNRSNGARKKKYFKNTQKIANITISNETSQNNTSIVAEQRRNMGETGGQSGSDNGERRKPRYTGGRDRQLKERHKGEFRRRQADKMRSGMF
uniref:CUE domain-containing protein n=1 Tax=Setaria digitata TaxID=48799 RepID=A0A915PY71_9BILA